MRGKNYYSVWFWLAVMAAFMFPGRAALSATLYERSLAQLAAKSERAAPEDYCFVVMGDNKEGEAVFLKALPLAVSFNPLFILHLGDISDQGRAEDVDHFLRLLEGEAAGVPFFVVRGNHEQEQPFAARVGPLDFTLDQPRLGLKVVAVDNSDYQLPAPRRQYIAGQLAVLRKYNFVAMHVPPATPRWPKHSFEHGAPELFELLAARKVSAAFYGHIHFYDRDEIRGVPQFVSGGAGARLARAAYGGDPSFHILVVRVRGGQAGFEMVRIKE